ncbi:MAG: hypothetical protein M1823_005763 [Watsoniomyces obsoletus]|nr:MAG: hypothetical protein M1823_005763 [Watsoniomyces obsoletus]
MCDYDTGAAASDPTSDMARTQSDRTFIISGGASGLGRATAHHLCEHGAYVAILDLNADLGAEVVSKLGPRARFVETDVTSSNSIAKAVQTTVEWARRTGHELGGVVAAAGIGVAEKIMGKDGTLMDIDNFDRVMAVNVRGTVDLVRQVLPHLSQVNPLPPDGERGVLVLISSVSAFEGQPGQVAYSASKGAIVGLTLPLTRDLARHGIRVVTVAPGPFETDLTTYMPDNVRRGLLRATEFPKRLGQPDEFALFVRQSIENPMLNGEVVRLDGGMRLAAKL